MKKQLLSLAMFLAVGLTLSSCKKDWVCTCDVTSHLGAGNGGDYNQQINTAITNSTQADAKKQCEDVYCKPFENNPSTTLNSATIH